MGGKSSKPAPPSVPDKDKRVQHMRENLQSSHQQQGHSHLGGSGQGQGQGGQQAHRTASNSALARQSTVANGNRRSLAVDLDPNGPGALVLFDGTRDNRGLTTANTATTTATESSLASTSSSGKDKGIDIVLIHGAGGGRTRTWTTDDGVCWPRDLLPRDLPPNTRVISWGWKAPDNIMDDHTNYGELCNLVSDQLSMDLARLDGGTERDLIFITHGVGGLIVKDALATTAISQVFGKRSEVGSIYPRTVGVIFLGTPHAGHGRQSLSEVAVLAARLDSNEARDAIDDAFMNMIRESNESLETQRGEFALISRDLPIVCVREQVATHAVRGAEILPKGSSTYEGLNVTTDDIFQDHAGLARYNDRHEPGFFQLVGHISKLTKRTHLQDTEASMIRSKEILDALHYDMREQENKASEDLKQTSAWILSAKDNEGSGAGDNVPGAFDHWLQDPGSPVFWISGNPGSGKTTLMRHAFHDPATHKLLRRWCESGVDANTKRRDRPELLTAAVFLFEAGSYVQKSREGILRGVLFQILSQKPDLIPICFPSFMQGPWPPPIPFNTTVNLSQAFYQLFARMSKTLRLCMFIDGLDEYRLAEGAQAHQDNPNSSAGHASGSGYENASARVSSSMDELMTETSTLALSEADASETQTEMTSTSDRGEILGNAQWIADSHTEIARLIMDLSAQDHVKLCVASRELPPFERAFTGVPRLRVHTQTEKLISQYCADRLDKVAPGLSGSQRPLCDEVARKSKGDILWARLAIDMLMEGSLRKIMATLESLPSQLGGSNGLYMRIIQNMSPDEQREAARIFHIILRAVDPPNLVILAFAHEGFMAPPKLQLADPTVGKLMIDHDRAHPYTRESLSSISDRMQSKLTTSCGDLLETTDKGNRVVFMHLTAKEFVLRSSVWKQARLPVPSAVDLDVSLISGIIRYLKCYSTLRLVVTSRPRLQFTPNAWLLVANVLRYASRVDERLIKGDNEECSRDVYVALLDDLDRTFQEAWQTAIKEHVPARDDVGWYRDKYRPLLASHWTDFEPMELGPAPRRHGFLSLCLQANLYGYVSYKVSQIEDPAVRAATAVDLLEYAVAPEGDSRTPDGGESLSAAGAVTGTYKDFHHDMPDGRFAPMLIEVVEQSETSGMDLVAQQRYVWTQAIKSGRQFFQQRGGRNAVLNLTRESTTTLGRNRGRWVAAIKVLLSSGWADPHLQIQDTTSTRLGGELKSAADMIKETLDGEVEFARELLMIEALIVDVAVRSPRAI